jgi:hypothetical protein
MLLLICFITLASRPLLSKAMAIFDFLACCQNSFFSFAFFRFYWYLDSNPQTQDYQFIVLPLCSRHWPLSQRVEWVLHFLPYSQTLDSAGKAKFKESNKLECLSLAGLSSLVECFRVRQEPTRVHSLPFMCSLWLVILGWKWENTLV